MGNYLNSDKAYFLYKSESVKPYFVDKSSMLEELCPLVQAGNSFICITRPRRFGKTVMANMIATYFSKAINANDIFESLAISSKQCYQENLNKYQVIQISFNEMPRKCTTYEQYISRIEKRVIDDLKEAYPQLKISKEEALWDILMDIFTYDNSARFLFVLDEWDFIFHRDFVTEEDKKSYISFLSNLLKDQPYVSLAYMTGILPIAKYSSGSELNMFLEYTMANEKKYAEYFGFTEAEVDEIYERFLQNEKKDIYVTREGLKQWYNGYHTLSGERLYNPRSVVASLMNNNLGSYWTSSGPYDEIYYYIEKNIDEVRDDLAQMAAGIAVPAKIKEYAATSMRLKTKDEIFSAMVVYGFLSYENGKVTIPNRELMDKFTDMLRKEPSLGYLNQLAIESERMLKATLCGDTKTMVEILEFAHDTEIPLLDYNNESELTALINLLYLSARDQYRVEREDKAGRGYVDFIFYPEIDKNADCIILELKVNDTPENAIQQIVDRKYALRLQGTIGNKQNYTGRILAVGIAYDKITKQHQCKIEEIER